MKKIIILLVVLAIAVQTNAQVTIEKDNTRGLFIISGSSYFPGVKYPCDDITIKRIVTYTFSGDPHSILGAEIVMEVIYTDLTTGLTYRENWSFCSLHKNEERGWTMSAIKK